MRSFVCLLLCTILFASLMLGGCSLMANGRPQAESHLQPTALVEVTLPPETQAPETTAVPAEPEATEAPAEAQAPSLQASAEEAVKGFAQAYFARDTEAMFLYLTDPFTSDVTLCQAEATELVDYRGLDTAGEKLETEGTCTLSLPYHPAPGADYYEYLSMELVVEKGQAKISWYGVEM